LSNDPSTRRGSFDTVPAELVFSEEADQALTKLEGEPRSLPLLGLVNATLAGLAEDPYHRRNNRQAYSGARRINIPDSDWMVLWAWHEGEALVKYIGPRPRAEGG
jgi:hypothetical protein